MTKLFFRPGIRIMIAFLFVFALFSGTVTGVKAAGADEDGIIEAGETIYDDVLLQGDTVRVDGTIEGNLLAFANTAVINGKIDGDAIIFANEVTIGPDAVIEGNLITGAQTVQISGQINRSLAVGSSALTIKSGASISRNLYFGGFSLETEPGSFVGVDLYVGEYQMLLNGIIGRDVNAGVAAAEINGTIHGDVTLEMGQMNPQPVSFPVPPGVSHTVQPGLRVGKNAVIGGNLKYTLTADQSSRIQAEPGGQVIFQTPVPVNATENRRNTGQGGYGWTIGSFILGILKKFWLNLFSLLLVGAVVVSFFPAVFKRTVQEVRRQPLASAGYGILTVILGYIGLLLAGFAILAISILLTVISAGGLETATFGFGFTLLALAGTIFTMLVIYGSKLVISYLVGNWILEKVSPESKAAEKPFWGLALGVLIYSLLRAIPFVGGVIALIVIILGVGAMWLVYRNRHEPNSSLLSETPEAPPAG